ncbi:MAG: polymer-forming cytoskeletal protein [Gammaproteobacteria bacterium]|nr:polymer-forming cytoskeletal protein [Gammaproteobacteria bacterium]MDH3562229.1 polymer-forming cytoskeletal protein [Gammaproteobacteria bacterium]MDH5486863.1 polymer-forming cytoskeletal protein [Gammaproteobacteria bacterium]
MKIEEILKAMGRKQRRRTLDHVEDFTSMLGPESVYTGVFQGKDNHIIYGQVQGDCDIEGILVLGEGSRWKGNIRANSVVIAGRVDGDIQAINKLELARTAYVHGKITSPVVAIARGAVHEGNIRMAKQTQITRFIDRREAEEKNRDRD